MPQFAVLHIEKAHSAVGGLGRHIDRTNIPLNADQEKQHLNRVLVNHNDHGSLAKAIDNRIEEGYKSKKTIRKDAVKGLNIVLSGSHERMKALEADSKGLDDWVQANQKWLNSEFGDKNVVSLALHMDERTPHLHAVVVPLTKDGRLSAKEILGNKNAMSDRQSRYGEAMKGFGLSRGIKGSRATHDSVKEYYARINNPVQSELSASEDKNMLGKVKGYKIEKDTLKDFIMTHKSMQTDNKKLKGDLFLKNMELDNAKRVAEDEKNKHSETTQKLKETEQNHIKHYGLLKAIGEGDEKALAQIKNHFQKLKQQKDASKQHSKAINPKKSPTKGKDKGRGLER